MVIIKKFETMKYYISKKLNTEFEKGLKQVIEALEKEGFGVVTQLDIQEKLQEKLKVDFRKYMILGACNPSFAYKALIEEDKIGLMLPCNVIIQELANNQIEVAAIDPTISMSAVENKELIKIAEEIKLKLERVIASL